LKGVLFQKQAIFLFFFHFKTYFVRRVVWRKLTCRGVQNEWSTTEKSGVLKEIQMEKCNKNKWQQQQNICKFPQFFFLFIFVVVGVV
jgi:hypothetical protein